MKLFETILIAGLSAMLAAPAAADDKAAVAIKLFQFQPKMLEVTAGTRIEWTNGDDIEHSVTSGVPGKPTNDFDSGFFTKGKSFGMTFDTPGTYDYFCKRHPSMKAKLVVTP